ncbi:15245_t:CDS:10, partial [Gigaspora margarita]
TASNNDSLILNAVDIRSCAQIIRYTCKCGYSYAIATYSQSAKAMRCPGCKNNVIDGAIYLSKIGNQKLDKTQITEPIKSIDQPGYIGEQVNNTINHSVRTIFLQTEKQKETDPLYLYICEPSLHFWPLAISELENLDESFPDSLFVNQAFEAYKRVHKNFRRILVLEKQLATADPALRNRFEKQRMIIDDFLTDNHQKIVKILSTWTQQMVSLKETNKTNALRTSFTRKDLFIGFDENETLQSLVIDVMTKFPKDNEETIIKRCKATLIDIAFSDGIIRASRSNVVPEINQWCNVYFRHLTDEHIPLQNHDCLGSFFAQLQNRIKRFWEESDDQMLIIQCDVTTRDQNHMSSLNFTCGWKQVTIEVLMPQEKNLSTILNDIMKCPLLIECLKTCALERIKEISTDDWQYKAPIAKILFVLEKLSVAKSIISINQTRRNQYLIPFLKTIFLDPKILNINDLPEPKPDLYVMSELFYDLKLPFSYYFMKKINGFKTAWGDELVKLKENPDNCNDDELSHDAFENAVQGFSEYVKTSLPAINYQVFKDFSEWFFDDFVTVMVANNADKKDSELFAKLVQLYIGKDKAFDPVLLHIYWWKYSNVISADLQLAQMCPSIINEFMLKELIPLPNIKEIIKLGLDSDKQNGLSKKFVEHVLGILSKFEKNEQNLSLQRSFIMRCLDTIPLDSVFRQHLYNNILSQKDPIPLMGSIITKIFWKEEDAINEPFLRILQDSKEILQASPRLKVINSALKNNNLDSSMATLCCDIIQKELFVEMNISEAAQYFKHAVEYDYNIKHNYGPTHKESLHRLSLHRLYSIRSITSSEVI